jgi:flagellar basal-body rod protein FlgC
MDMFKSMEISSTGLAVQRQRMEIIANNIANSNTTRTDKGGPFRRQQLVFSEVIGKEGAKGVKVSSISEDTSPLERVYDPGHPDADANGYVEMPNINIVKEMVDLISASRTYEANVSTMNTSKNMFLKALDIGRK